MNKGIFFLTILILSYSLKYENEKWRSPYSSPENDKNFSIDVAFFQYIFFHLSVLIALYDLVYGSLNTAIYYFLLFLTTTLYKTLFFCLDLEMN